MKNRNLSFSLSVYLIGSEILLAVIIIIVGYWFAKDLIQENLFHKVRYHTEEVISPLNTSLNESKWLIDNFANENEGINDIENPEKYSKLVFRIKPSVIALRYLTFDGKDSTKFISDQLFYRKGETIINDREDFNRDYIKAGDWMNEVSHTTIPEWSSPFYSDKQENGERRQILIYAKPIQLSTGFKISRSIIFCAISLDNRLKTFHQLELYRSGLFLLISDKGKVIYPSDNGQGGIGPDILFQFGKKGIDIKEVLKNGEEGSTIVYPDYLRNKKSMAMYWPVGSIHWLAVSVLPESEYLAGLDRILFISILIILFIGSISAAVAVYLSIRLVSPITVLANASRKIIEQEGEQGTNWINEVEALSESIEIMKRKLKNYESDRLKAEVSNDEMDKELKLARDIEMGIVPTKFPLFPGRCDFDCYGKLIPAKIVGGDLFDFFLLDDNNLFISICDTMGKGIPAAMFAVATRTLIRSIANPITRIGKMMELLNDELSISTESDMFVTVMMGRLNLSNGEFAYCNAGHPKPIILKNNHQIEELETSHGFPIGVRKKQKFVESTVELAPGELLIAYTDGITEEVDKFGSFYGKERLLSVLQIQNSATPEKIVKEVLKSLDHFRGKAEIYDDTTILALKYIGKD
jgi:phosphoserine phosphatase RsbU/P